MDSKEKKGNGLKFSWFKAELTNLNERLSHGNCVGNALDGRSTDPDLMDTILALETRQKRKKSKKPF